MTGFLQFDSPNLLHLLWAVPLQGLVLYIYWSWRQRTLRRLGSQALEKRLLQGFSGRRFWTKNLLFGASLALIAIAISNPMHLTKRPGEVQKSADVLIALDISNSMLAKDVTPSRLDRAKAFIRELVEGLKGERIGLIFFAGDAYPQMPLSNDYESLLLFTRNARPEYITDQGTNIAAAIDLAGRMFESGGEAGRALILISDGENHQENAMQRAKEITRAGVVLHTVAVGTAKGTTIPAGRNSVRKDFSGKAVRTSANESLMASLARAGGGSAYRLQEEARALAEIRTAIQRLPKSTIEARTTAQYISYYQWFLIPALLFLIIEQLLWWKKPSATEG
ncbi:MAG: VWA domain-containing protein [Lewinellaceae bacterium]|nr:VWA domain-containing protein [Lewinellaceae bacterium]